MMRSSRVFVDNEYEYLVHMIPHHQEAVDNAEILRDHTERKEMRDFAEKIIRTQREEIQRMQGFLEEWYPEEEHQVDYEPMMGNYENLTGEELDRIFLEDMIPHHMEAVMMSQQLLMRRLAEHEEVAALARDIRNSQRDEIHQMEGWLSDWYGDSSRMTADDDSSWMTWDTGSRGMMRRNPLGNLFVWGGIVLIVTALVVFLLLNKSGPHNKSRSTTDQSAKEILDRRLAKGEITEEEYQKKREQMEA